ncbi:hypothetical protein B0H11DRAFT_1230256 [Mycena galericulata]|nr:hypothetical protein B0H11DRAFT_1230256 [Mycena galericulata]
MRIRRQDSGHPNTCQRASDLLASSPEVARYVHSLHIPLPTLLKEMHALESALRTPTLHNVRSLEVYQFQTRSWNFVPAGLASVVFDIISLATLDQLDLNSMTDVPSSLIYCAASSVRMLSLFHVTMHRQTPSVATQPPPSALCLDHLILHSGMLNVRNFLRDLTGEGHLRSLRGLSIQFDSSPYEDHIETFTGIFAPLSATLLQLDLDYGRFRSLHMIPQFENLQVLNVSFNIGVDRAIPDYLTRIVSGLPEFAPRVESIAFTLAIVPLVQETPWVQSGLSWPLFRAGFIERHDLP